MIIATMTAADEAELEDPASLGLPQLFERHHHVPLLGPEEASLFITARNIKRSVQYITLRGGILLTAEVL